MTTTLSVRLDADTKKRLEALAGRGRRPSAAAQDAPKPVEGRDLGWESEVVEDARHDVDLVDERNQVHVLAALRAGQDVEPKRGVAFFRKGLAAPGQQEGRGEDAHTSIPGTKRDTLGLEIVHCAMAAIRVNVRNGFMLGSAAASTRRPHREEVASMEPDTRSF